MASVKDPAVLATHYRAKLGRERPRDGSQLTRRIGAELLRADELHAFLVPAEHAPPFAYMRKVQLRVSAIVAQHECLPCLGQTHGIVAVRQTHARYALHRRHPFFERDSRRVRPARDVNHVRHTKIPAVIRLTS